MRKTDHERKKSSAWKGWSRTSNVDNGSRNGPFYPEEKVGGGPQRPQSQPPRHWNEVERVERNPYLYPVRPVGRMLEMPSSITPNFYEYHFRDPYGQGSRSVLGSRTSSRSFSTSRVGSDVDFLVGGDSNASGLPYSRQWEHTGLGSLIFSNNRKNDTSTFGGGGTRFTLMSYNILAAGLLEKHSELYEDSEPGHLEWETRVRLIFEEIEKCQPDIVCLQEVEEAQFSLTFERRLNPLGYRGVYKKKTGDKEDGVAIFYKTRFLLIDTLEIEFLQPHIPLLNRDNVGLLVKLETRGVASNRFKIVVGTTHLLFNPKREDVKLAQAQLLLAELDRFAFCGFDRSGKALYYPVLMTGDFNCRPNTSVTKLFNDGSFQYLDEKGEFIRLLKRKAANTLIPPQCGITDQCQHYKIVLERYKRWKSTRVNNFELDTKTQESLVNLFPYIEHSLSPTPFLTPPDELIALLSPVTEGVEPASSYTEAADSQFFNKAAKKIAEFQKDSTAPAADIFNNASSAAGKSSTQQQTHSHLTRNHNLSNRLDEGVLADLQRYGLQCTFGSGNLTHNLLFRDVYAPRLDRTQTDGIITTKQHGWCCVDYIFQSMTWNPAHQRRVEGKLKLIRRLGLFGRNQCKEVGSIPNNVHPSDHFPLLAEFQLRQ